MTTEEKELDKKFTEILELLNEGVHEPAGSGCGFGFDADYQEDAFEVFKKAISQHTLSIIEKAVGDRIEQLEAQIDEPEILNQSRIELKIEVCRDLLTRVKQMVGE